MKKILLVVLCALFCGFTCVAQEMTKEQKEKMKSEIKTLKKDGWKAAGTAKLEDVIENSYKHMADTIHWVCGTGKGAGIDARAAIAGAEDLAQKDALSKVKARMKALGIKKMSGNMDFKNVMTVFKTKDGNGYAIVRVAMKLPEK